MGIKSIVVLEGPCTVEDRGYSCAIVYRKFLPDLFNFCWTFLNMPGVNLELPPASSTEEMGSPDCAESGPETTIGDLLAGDKDFDGEQKLESLLHCEHSESK